MIFYLKIDLRDDINNLFSLGFNIHTLKKYSSRPLNEQQSLIIIFVGAVALEEI